jgi:hypothetical protein
MTDSERFKLIYGPYTAPKCGIGDTVLCDCRGQEVTVTGMTDAPIPWPCTHGNGRPCPVLCGDLIRAVRTESALAVAYHWDVCTSTVAKWRRALNVPRITNGSRRLLIENAAEVLTPLVRAKGKAAMHSPEVRAKLSALRKGRRQHPNTTAAFREIAKRPKSEEWKRGQSERSRKMWENPEAYGLPRRRPWSAEETALLGTDTDRAISERLGIPKRAVTQERVRLRIPGLSQLWNEQETALLGTAPDSQLAARIGKSATAIRQRRDRLGIPAFRVVEWTDVMIGLLGTASDAEIGSKLGISSTCVQRKREQLRIPAFVARWSAAEIALLGSDTDRNIAKLLGRTEMAVMLQRCKKNIPAYC